MPCKKNWTVPLRKLSASDTYALSKPSPNWDNINPYSGLEEEFTDTNTKSKDCAITSATVDTKVSATNNTSSGTTSAHHYQFRTRNHTWPRLRRTVRTRNSSVKCVESDNSSSDSNYTPKTKWKKSASSNLKEPSKSRLQPQKMIVESKRHRLLGSSDAANYPVLPDDEERNKRCPLCPATFYFETGVAMHLAHAHGQHAGEPHVMGVNASTKSDVMGINNATQIQHMETAVTGRNKSAKETSAPIANPTVNDTNDQTVNATPPPPES